MPHKESQNCGHGDGKPKTDSKNVAKMATHETNKTQKEVVRALDGNDSVLITTKDNERLHIEQQSEEQKTKKNKELNKQNHHDCVASDDDACCLVALTTGQYKPAQENPGFLTLVLRAIQEMTHSKCITQEVHVHAQFPEYEGSPQSRLLPPLNKTNNGRNYMAYAVWTDEASCLKSVGQLVDLLLPPKTSCVSNNSTPAESGSESDLAGGLDEEMFDVAKSAPEPPSSEPSSTRLKKVSNGKDKHQASQSDTFMAAQAVSQKHDCFETVQTELWRRIGMEDSNSAPKAEDRESRTCSAYAVLFKVKCPSKEHEVHGANSRMLSDCRKLALQEEGCLSYDVHTRYNDDHMHALGKKDGEQHGNSVRAKSPSFQHQKLSDEFMIYAVFATKTDVAFHMQQNHCVFVSCEKNITDALQVVPNEEGLAATFGESFWRRSDFPTAQKKAS